MPSSATAAHGTDKRCGVLSVVFITHVEVHRIQCGRRALRATEQKLTVTETSFEQQSFDVICQHYKAVVSRSTEPARPSTLSVDSSHYDQLSLYICAAYKHICIELQKARVAKDFGHLNLLPSAVQCRSPLYPACFTATQTAKLNTTRL